MFLRWLNWNHRVKLSALLTVTVSVALALVFALVVFLVREQALNRRFSELESNVKRISHEWSTPDSWREVQDDFPGVDVAVYGSSGNLLASTTKKSPPLVKGRSKSGDILTFGFQDGGNIFVGMGSWAETEAGLKQLSLVLAILWLPLTLLTAAVSWYGGGLVLRPVTELVDSAKKLSGSADGECLTTSDHAEFAELARSLNQLIERVRHSASLQEQFASDAAHELRNPLALLRTRIEANLMKERTPEEHVTSQRSLLRQIDRLTAIVETLLFSARQSEPSSYAADLGESVRSVVEEWAESRGWPESRIRLNIQPCKAPIFHEEVGIIFRNLLDNSARHSPQDSSIEVDVTVKDERVHLSVRDHGPGLSKEEMGLAFERFYRSDEGRSRKHGGSGIGLAVVRRIVESHSGSVRFVEVEAGALVEIVLPAT
jgi:signal transduction histidine kinase